MRDPNRIDEFCNKLRIYWRGYFPDYRFGQFMMNFLGWIQSEKGDPFFPEENKMLEYLKEYSEKYSPYHIYKENKNEINS